MTNPPPLITLTSDFGVQTQGVGTMEATAFAIAPQAKIIHLMHGLPSFNVIAAARTMESLKYFPVGYHVCVCDPGVGSSRRAIICEVKRGDYLVGPDNGVLLPASRVLGGIERVNEISNRKYMLEPVSFLFHGRDVFTPAAAHLANGVRLEDFGASLSVQKLVKAAYEEAIEKDGGLEATVIQINKFGSIHLNILHDQWDSLKFSSSKNVSLILPGNKKIILPVGDTFGDVPSAMSLITKDDFGRVQVSKNMGSFVNEHPINIGDKLVVLPTLI